MSTIWPGDRGQIIQQGRQNDLHWIGAHRQEFDCANPHPGLTFCSAATTYIQNHTGSLSE